MREDNSRHLFKAVKIRKKRLKPFRNYLSYLKRNNLFCDVVSIIHLIQSSDGFTNVIFHESWVIYLFLVFFANFFAVSIKINCYKGIGFCVFCILYWFSNKNAFWRDQNKQQIWCKQNYDSWKQDSWSHLMNRSIITILKST